MHMNAESPFGKTVFIQTGAASGVQGTGYNVSTSLSWPRSILGRFARIGGGMGGFRLGTCSRKNKE
jgi:hypothetical protein